MTRLRRLNPSHRMTCWHPLSQRLISPVKERPLEGREKLHSFPVILSDSEEATRTKEESKAPENISSAVPHQGVLTSPSMTGDSLVAPPPPAVDSLLFKSEISNYPISSLPPRRAIPNRSTSITSHSCTLEGAGEGSAPLPQMEIEIVNRKTSGAESLALQPTELACSGEHVYSSQHQ